MSTLYRKYRPFTFKETVGQNHVKITLQNEIQAGKIGHAYLFCGPRAVGKTTLSRVFSKAINCLNRKEGESEPCNRCDSCTDINNSRSLDIVEIDAASHTGVDNVRENIIASARVAPSKSKYKVFIIDEVHMLSISAFNALLKIMEEPPENVVFILCTTEVHKVPSTIISRCQRFDFKRIGVNDLVAKLNYIIKQEKIKIDNKILESIARQSEGYMRDAESLLSQLVAIGGKEITQAEADLVIPRSDLNEIINLIGFLSKKDAASGIKLINNLVDGGVDLKVFLNDLIEVLRKMMISKISPGLSEKLGIELGESLELKLNEISQGLDISSLIDFINKFSETRNKIKDSSIMQLPIELAIAELSISKKTLINQGPTLVNQVNKPTGGAPTVSNSAPTPTLNPQVNTNLKQSPANVDKNQVLEKWNEVLVKIKKYNHSLSFILRACEPRDMNDNQLCLAFKYKFHKDRVSNPEIKSIIENVLSEVYGGVMSIEALIDESLEISGTGEPQQSTPSFGEGSDSLSTPESNEKIEPSDDNNNQDNNPMVDNLLKTFGGKVVN